ncbi:hypothetical protein CYMTET_29489 [Cymbomonas tetramitiformis]|uniref:Uncharacterized protein n=1 Tax=Cymbomonas tetramitiformis TaxID=36881 RepID=A0AAE0FL02_9CHLO|nr:hypothetical protein CYMTET_29489 [Cymbomonas tetramitiformis]
MIAWRDRTVKWRKVCHLQATQEAGDDLDQHGLRDVCEHFIQGLDRPAQQQMSPGNPDAVEQHGKPQLREEDEGLALLEANNVGMIHQHHHDEMLATPGLGSMGPHRIEEAGNTSSGGNQHDIATRKESPVIDALAAWRRVSRKAMARSLLDMTCEQRTALRQEFGRWSAERSTRTTTF